MKAKGNAKAKARKAGTTGKTFVTQSIVALETARLPLARSNNISPKSTVNNHISTPPTNEISKAHTSMALASR